MWEKYKNLIAPSSMTSTFPVSLSAQLLIWSVVKYRLMSICILGPQLGSKRSITEGIGFDE